MGLVVLLAASLSLHFIVQSVLHVPIAGSIPLFLCGALLHLLATTSLGVFMGTVARNMPQLGLLMILILLPAPTTHFVSLSQAILYRGAGFDVVWPSFLAIIAIGAVFFVLALALFR